MTRLEQKRRNVALIAEQRRQATHCKRGHAFTPENTYLRRNGRRACRTCLNDRIWYYRHGIAWAR